MTDPVTLPREVVERLQDDILDADGRFRDGIAEVSTRDLRTLLSALSAHQEREARAREALGRIKDDWNVNHTSKWCHDTAAAALQSLKESRS